MVACDGAVNRRWMLKYMVRSAFFAHIFFLVLSCDIEAPEGGAFGSIHERYSSPPTASFDVHSCISELNKPEQLVMPTISEGLKNELMERFESELLWDYGVTGWTLSNHAPSKDYLVHNPTSFPVLAIVYTTGDTDVVMDAYNADDWTHIGYDDDSGRLLEGNGSLNSLLCVVLSPDASVLIVVAGFEGSVGPFDIELKWRELN